ncbi:MAG TPA: hypothetical protein VF612_05420 [Jatrophihabitans sp.]|jgi:hypothetical protein|uniref:hypothetical protein n=1 Tax=Jatrophihabitans sp. TaxID=1932789 RepID=UPI002EF96D6A
MNSGEWSPPPAPPYGGANQPARGRRGLLVGGGLLATGVVAGAIIGGTVLSGAATTSPSPTAPSSTSSSAPGAGEKAPNRQSTPVRGDEKAVTADQAAKLKAAALKAVPGGTVYRVETDGDGDAYEAHMTKADGSPVTVKFDENFAVVKVEEGMGPGGGRGHGGPGSGDTDDD